jgi:hypothetical protein
VAGLGVGALATVLALRLLSATGGSSSPLPPDPAAGDSRPRASDIADLSPEERAARLYTRVLSLRAHGQDDSAAFFLPMALQAYALLPALDFAARYHVGVLALAGGHAATALAQADTIRRAVSSHLFAFMLRARSLELRGDADGARRAYRDFLAHERAERARHRPEYGDEAQALDAFHTQATARSAGTTTRGR